ncbi:MAG: Cache 3/Cache 2 fusion domain-containing protein [Desulfuromonas sp.]|nr:Cache 3/Cache 2 fusion domain-containing protein [Desulfuromonas sp.]
MNIRTKITGTIITLVLITALSIVGIATVKNRALRSDLGTVIDDLAFNEAKKQAQSVHLLCEAMRESVEQTVVAHLNVSNDVLERSGELNFADEMVPWDAVNQFSKQKTSIHLPKMMFGDLWPGKNKDINQKTPIIDDVIDLVGGTCTIFQRMNDQGDMLRVATNVEKLDGTRAIGTYIPRTNPDGSENKVIATVLGGRTFRGRAFVVNAWYVTAYQPIWDTAHQKVVGILYFGEKQENVDSLRKGILNSTVGKTGYVFVLGGKGKQKGKYIISKDGKRDGENILNATDATGKTFIQSIIQKATSLPSANGGDIPLTREDYKWKNAGDSEAKKKCVAIAYFEPWDWVIGAGYYQNDFSASHAALSVASNSMIRWIIIFAVTIAFVALIIGYFLANRISGPIKQTLSMIENLGQGNLSQRLNFTQADEVGQLGKAMDAFADNLQDEILTAFEKLAEGDFTFKAQGLISEPLHKANSSLNDTMTQINTAGNQITSGATQVSDSSQALSQGATEQASSLEQINSSMTEVSSQTKLNADNATMANTLAKEACNVAQQGNQQMKNMIEAMAEINQASQEISKIIKVIDEIAFQTNLLALNAAVEAARAGQHGKGFAVVAEEVRNLAARSAKAASETATLIEGSVQKVENGAQIADTTGEALNEISTGITKVSDLVAEIAESSNEQANGISQISIGLNQIDDVTQQNTSTAEQSAAAAEELASQAHQLQSMLNRFSLSNNQSPDSIALIEF